jgi:hypothetical protein
MAMDDHLGSFGHQVVAGQTRSRWQLDLGTVGGTKTDACFGGTGDDEKCLGCTGSCEVVD